MTAINLLIIREDLKSRKTFKCSGKILPIQNLSKRPRQNNQTNTKGATFLLRTKYQKTTTTISRKTVIFPLCQKSPGRKTRTISTHQIQAARKQLRTGSFLKVAAKQTRPTDGTNAKATTHPRAVTRMASQARKGGSPTRACPRPTSSHPSTLEVRI